MRRSIVYDSVPNNYDFMLKPKEKSLGEFIYDSKTGKFLTRTPKSWCKESENFLLLKVVDVG